MEVIPAIDLRGGRVVRLRHGRFDDETGYGLDPCAAVRRWEAEGARQLHVVDLDGARDGRPTQAALVARVIAEAGVPCQVAGGLRHGPAVASALEAGAARAVLGTALLERPGLAVELIARHGRDRLASALDVRDGRAVGDGWVPGARARPLADAVAVLVAAGLDRLVVTAIARDGDLAGPDLELLGRVRRLAPGVELIASGGVSGLDDLRALADLGCDAAIIGRALYEGRLALAEALAAAGA